MKWNEKSIDIIVKPFSSLYCLCDRSWNTWAVDFCEATRWLTCCNFWIRGSELVDKLPTRAKENRRDKFGFPLNLASLCLILLFAFPRFSPRLANRISLVACSIFDKTCTEIELDKWFCAIAIFIHSLFFRYSNANSILLNFQFHSIFSDSFFRVKMGRRCAVFCSGSCLQVTLPKLSGFFMEIHIWQWRTLPVAPLFIRFHDFKLNRYSDMIFFSSHS